LDITDRQFKRQAAKIKDEIIHIAQGRAKHPAIQNIQDIFREKADRLYHGADQGLGVAWREESFGQRLKFQARGEWHEDKPQNSFLASLLHQMSWLVQKLVLFRAAL
jgi:hypothetical protein